MKKYTDHNTEELLKLTNEELADSIKAEALDRGLKIPTPLPDQIKNLEWKGLQIPAESIKLYELTASNEYGSPAGSGIAYQSEERAKEVLMGAICVDDKGYGSDKKKVISKGEAGIQIVHVGVTSQESITSKIDQHVEECGEYEDLRKELIDDHSEKRQGIYNKQVRESKRAEFMRLAGGDIAIAKAFWSKQESRDFPTVLDEDSKKLIELLK